MKYACTAAPPARGCQTAAVAVPRGGMQLPVRSTGSDRRRPAVYLFTKQARLRRPWQRGLQLSDCVLVVLSLVCPCFDGGLLLIIL